jgi:hypothetical protein
MSWATYQNLALDLQFGAVDVERLQNMERLHLKDKQERL